MKIMKKLARNYVWWSGIDADVENTVRSCESCQLNQRLPNKSSLLPHPWIRHQGPWEGVHIDFAGPYRSFIWMIVADAFP